jgi:two-component system NarL family response regulator
MPIRVLLADDHKMFREALRAMLERDANIAVIGEAGDGLSALDQARSSVPDVVVMDINMPGLNGIEATRQLLASHPDIGVIALSAYFEKSFVTEMLGAGAKGYVVKEAASEELLRAIRIVAHGQTYLSPEVATAMVQATLAPNTNGQGELQKLGKRERQVLQLLADGLTSPQIAARLHISPGTVDVHRRNIMQKLALHSVAELTKWAIRHGVTSV